MSDKLCILPWISTEIDPTGRFSPCCLFKDTIKKENGKEYKIQNGDSVQDAFRSKYMDQLRKDFLDNKKPKACSDCWTLEKSGGTSKRMHSNNIFGNKNLNDPNLVFLDLKFGNICNLKCRICGSHSSSKWAQEEMKLYDDGGRSETNARIALKEGAWPRQTEKFWQDLIPLLPQITYMEFTGGEPMMIQQHFDLLDISKKEGWCAKQKIHYNTNGTHYPEYAVKHIWPYFKNVEIAFSIDDLDKRFEYQRYGADWHLVNKNIQKFHEFRKQHKNITTQVCSTINIFNVYNFEDLAVWIDQQKFNFVFINFLHNAKEWCIKYLPQQYKDKINQKLSKYHGPDSLKPEVDNILNFMNNDIDQLDWVNGSRTMKILASDKFRNENFYSVFPEYKGLLDA